MGRTGVHRETGEREAAVAAHAARHVRECTEIGKIGAAVVEGGGEGPAGNHAAAVQHHIRVNGAARAAPVEVRGDDRRPSGDAGQWRRTRARHCAGVAIVVLRTQRGAGRHEIDVAREPRVPADRRLLGVRDPASEDEGNEDQQQPAQPHRGILPSLAWQWSIRRRRCPVCGQKVTESAFRATCARILM